MGKALGMIEYKTVSAGIHIITAIMFNLIITIIKIIADIKVIPLLVIVPHHYKYDIYHFNQYLCFHFQI